MIQPVTSNQAAQQSMGGVIRDTEVSPTGVPHLREYLTCLPVHGCQMWMRSTAARRAPV